MSVEKNKKVLDTWQRIAANKRHKTYQSPLERGTMPQHIVNKVLSMFGEH